MVTNQKFAFILRIIQLCSNNPGEHSISGRLLKTTLNEGREKLCFLFFIFL